MVRAPEFVDNFMTTPVPKIDEESTIKEAQKLLESLDTRILVVTRNEKPVCILEDWRIWGVEMDKKIKDIENMLEPAYTVRSGAQLPSVMQQLEERTAIIINDTEDKNMIGILTVTDLLRKKSK